MDTSETNKVRVIAVDFESFYAKGFDISSLGSWHYLNDPRCDIYLMGVAGDGIAWAGHPKDFDWSLLNGAFIIAHNLAWDGLVLAKLSRDGVIPADIEFAGGGCTANMACFLGAPRNLAGAARELLGADVTKDLRTWMKGRSWQDAVDAGREGELREYVMRDAQTCFDLWQRHSPSWPDNERKLAHLTMTMGWRGVRIDPGRVDESTRALDMVMWEARNAIPWADGDSAVLSIKALGEHCRAAGVAPPASTAEDDPACVEWERVNGDKFPWVSAMRTWRKTNTLREKLRTMIDRTRPTDGCMGFGLKYFGAHTGRWSGDSGFSVHNLPRGESHGADLRACIVPRPGKTFIVCDLSQIEPRVLAWLSGDTIMLDQLANGVPIYEAHARATMGWTGGNLKKENAELYALAKARLLGLGYQCGPARFVEVARNMAGIVISQQQATRTVESFRSSNRKITALWASLQNDFHRSKGGDFVVELPSGRRLTYRDVRSSGGWTARVTSGGPRFSIYGGKLVENCVGEGTEVLTDRGWVPIEQVGPADHVWDGVEWVSHDGVVQQGNRETIDFGGVQITPDHKVLTRQGWLAAAETTHREATHYYAQA